MSEGYPGAGRRDGDHDLPTEPEPGSSVFGPPADPGAAGRRSYPPRTQVQEQPSYPGELPPPGAAPYPETSPYPGQSPYADSPAYSGQPPYSDPTPHLGQSPYQDPTAYPGQVPYPDPSALGQVHIPAPPPGVAPEGPPATGVPQPQAGPRRARRPPEDRPARGSGVDLPIGAGTVVGVAGLVCFLLGLLVLPWFTAGGQEVTLSDLRTAFTIPETQPDDLPGASEGDPSVGTDGVPTPEEVGDVAEDQVRDRATEAAAGAIDDGKARYLELYVERLWIFAAVGVALAVLFSTILAPRSFALSLILGFRRLSGFVTMLVGAAHGAALWIVFTGDGAPDPTFGVWLGVGGLAAVLVGCILGPKRRSRP